MNKNKLFIIGNGFDIYHGINSTFKDFRCYLESGDRDLCEKLQEYFDYDNLWSDFEQYLAAFDENHLREIAEDFLVPYSADPWSDAFHHDYQEIVNGVVEALSDTLKSRFTSWVLQLKIPPRASCKKKLNYIDASALFLSFNYTQTLQHLYSIPAKNVLHIHGQAGSGKPTIILGHAWNPIDRTRRRVNLDAEDPRITEGNQIIDRYFTKTYKPTAKIIKKNEKFFRSLISVKEIFVLGHSMSMVDIAYFHQIVTSINLRNVKWYISYFGNDELNRHRDAMQKLGVSMKKIHFADIGSLGP